jgi:hypothetical protein
MQRTGENVTMRGLTPETGRKCYHARTDPGDPDGEKNGTAGCIGIQTVPACLEVQKILNKFHGLKVRCVRE